MSLHVFSLSSVYWSPATAALLFVFLRSNYMLQRQKLQGASAPRWYERVVQGLVYHKNIMYCRIICTDLQYVLKLWKIIILIWLHTSPGDDAMTGDTDKYLRPQDLKELGDDSLPQEGYMGFSIGARSARWEPRMHWQDCAAMLSSLAPQYLIMLSSKWR